MVSIHTPIQGVTKLIKHFVGADRFQSTHPYRVWLVRAIIQRFQLMFQSTHPYRVWPRNGLPCSLSRVFQSTHPYRVWLMATDNNGRFTKFQSTHPYRVWPMVPYSVAFYDKFQSTHPYRVWLQSAWWMSLRMCFNPHTHTGCDINLDWLEVFCIVSIHTPIQGVTFGVL